MFNRNHIVKRSILLSCIISTSVCISGCKEKVSSAPAEYKACAYLVQKDDHYNIGIEIHTDNRNVEGLNPFTEEEFGNLITLTDEDNDDGKNYCPSENKMNSDFKEWITAEIKNEDIEKVLNIMKQHKFELNLVDPDGNYPSIHEVVQLEVIDAR